MKVVEPQRKGGGTTGVTHSVWAEIIAHRMHSPHEGASGAMLEGGHEGRNRSEFPFRAGFSILRSA
jgi:hypothetical protein